MYTLLSSSKKDLIHLLYISRYVTFSYVFRRMSVPSSGSLIFKCSILDATSRCKHLSKRADNPCAYIHTIESYYSTDDILFRMYILLFGMQSNWHNPGRSPHVTRHYKLNIKVVEYCINYHFTLGIHTPSKWVFWWLQQSEVLSVYGVLTTCTTSELREIWKTVHQ